MPSGLEYVIAVLVLQPLIGILYAVAGYMLVSWFTRRQVGKFIDRRTEKFREVFPGHD